MYTYDITYEMQNGERRTCIVTHYSLVKAAARPCGASAALLQHVLYIWR